MTKADEQLVADLWKLHKQCDLDNDPRTIQALMDHNQEAGRDLSYESLKTSHLELRREYGYTPHDCSDHSAPLSLDTISNDDLQSLMDQLSVKGRTE